MTINRSGAAPGVLVRAFAALALGALGAVHAGAQTFPEKPIQIVVPFAAGGGVDIVARALAESITRRQGHAVVVENKTGAGGNIGSAHVARARPDGHTLLLASNSNAVNHLLYADVGYGRNDLRPVTLVGTVPMVMLLNPKVPSQDLPQLIAAAKAAPGTLSFGSGGSGTGEHLTLELFKRQAGIDVLHVPYKGGAQVFTDLVGGQIQGRFSNLLAATPFIQSGQLRAIAITGSKRTPQFPELRTFTEQGLSGLDVYAWWGVMAPSGVPPDVLDRLSTIFNAALKDPQVADRLKALGATPAGGSPAEFSGFFTAEVDRWSPIVREARIKAD